MTNEIYPTDINTANDFEDIATTYLWIPNQKINSYKTLKNKIKSKLLVKELKYNNYGLIYSNTITNGAVHEYLKHFKIPIITHVHELEYWINKTGPENLSQVISATTQYIAVSKAVKENLIQHGIKDEDINLVYEFTYFEKYKDRQPKSLKSKLNLPADAIIIGASGAEIWRKEKDLFIPLAVQVLNRSQKNIHFVWIGGGVPYEIEYDLKMSGFADKIHFINHLPNTSNYFHDFYLFLMLSREDPFPIVNLEAGLRAVPILCFEKSGGTPELLEFEHKNIIPYLNLNAMSRRIHELLDNINEKENIGQELKHKIISRYDISNILPAIVDIIENVIKKQIHE